MKLIEGNASARPVNTAGSFAHEAIPLCHTFTPMNPSAVEVLPALATIMGEAVQLLDPPHKPIHSVDEAVLAAVRHL